MLLDRKIAPEAHEIQGMSLVHPREINFDNGLKVLVFHSPDQDLVKAEFVFGNVYGEHENPLLNMGVCAMLKEGTSRLNSAQIADNIDYYGAYLVPEFSFDHTALTLYTLNKYMHEVFPIVYDILTDVAIPQHELDTYIRNNKQSLQIALEKNEVISKRTFYENLFPSSRYGIVVTESGLDTLRRDELMAVFRKQFQPNNCTLFLSGNITNEVIDLVAVLFDTKWTSEQPKPILHAPLLTDPASTSLIYQEKPNALQSALRLGKQTITRKDPDFPALQFVNTLFGGYFGSRLMQNIREVKGYTYGIGSSVVSFQYAGMLTLATQVGVDVTQPTLDEIQHEIYRLHDSLADGSEVELVRNYLLGAMLGSLESIFSHADKFKAVYFSGMDLSYYDYYTSVVKSMEPQKIQAIAQKYLTYDDLVKVVVGKM